MGGNLISLPPPLPDYQKHDVVVPGAAYDIFLGEWNNWIIAQIFCNVPPHKPPLGGPWTIFNLSLPIAHFERTDSILLEYIESADTLDAEPSL